MRNCIKVLLLGTLLFNATYVWGAIGESMGRKIINGISKALGGNEKNTAYITGGKFNKANKKKTTKKNKSTQAQDESAKETGHLIDTGLGPGTLVMSMECDQGGCWGTDESGKTEYFEWPKDVPADHFDMDYLESLFNEPDAYLRNP